MLGMLERMGPPTRTFSCVCTKRSDVPRKDKTTAVMMLSVLLTIKPDGISMEEASKQQKSSPVFGCDTTSAAALIVKTRTVYFLVEIRAASVLFDPYKGVFPILSGTGYAL